MMVQLFAGQHLTKTQPQSMQEVYFVAGEIGGMRAEDLVNLVAVWEVDLKIELRFGIGQLLPGLTDLPRLLFGVVLSGAADNYGAGLQRAGGAQNTVPEIV